MINIQRILVPVDFSHGSEQALDLAMDWAEMWGARVHVLHVWQPPPYLVPEMIVTDPGGDSMQFDDFMKARTGRDLDRFVGPHRRDGVSIVCDVEAGTPQDVILEYLQAHAFDLVVMGTHGHRGLMHLLMGSVAEGVVRAAPCPVMTIRDPEGRPYEATAD
jgi:nucleotide-binding universal stress UspA family protein